MSELWEREFDNTEYESCIECGNAIYNGESYYEIDGMIICEVCMNNFYKRIMDYDEYTYQDYLTERYERERHSEISLGKNEKDMEEDNAPYNNDRH